MQCCNGGEPRGPRRVGCQRIISQARDVPPRFPHSRRRSQSVWPLRTTVGVIRNLRFCLPDPPLTARDGAKHECTNNKIESLQQTFTCAHWHFKSWVSPKNSNPSDINYNADSDLSTDIYCKISENHLQVTRLHLENLNYMNSDNNDMWNPDTLFIDAIHNDSSIMWQ